MFTYACILSFSLAGHTPVDNQLVKYCQYDCDNGKRYNISISFKTNCPKKHTVKSKIKKD